MDLRRFTRKPENWLFFHWGWAWKFSAACEFGGKVGSCRSDCDSGLFGIRRLLLWLLRAELTQSLWAGCWC